MAPGFEDRLRRGLERAAGEPTGGPDAYEQVVSKKARRRVLRRVQSVALVVAVLAGTVGGAFGLAKAFNLGGAKREHQVAAGPSATNGRIAFVSNRDGNNEIYSMEPDGSDLRNLTDNTASDTEPAWSPDGSRIAFISNRDGIPDIYLMNADGTEVRRITTEAYADPTSQLAWSPGGDAIALAGASPKPCTKTTTCGWATLGWLWTFRLRGGEHSAFSGGTGNREPVWGPGGTTILFVRSVGLEGGPTSLVQKDLSTGAESNVLPAPGHDPAEPSLSPAGDRVAFFSQFKGLIWTMSFPSGTELTQLDPRPAGTPGNDFDPYWSPDGQKIVFASTRDIKDDSDPNVEIYVMNADGTDPVRLTDDQGVDDQPSWQPIPVGGIPIPPPTPTLAPPQSPVPTPVPTVPPEFGVGPGCDVSMTWGDFDGDGQPDQAWVYYHAPETRCAQDPIDDSPSYMLSVRWSSEASGRWPLPECLKACRVRGAADLNSDGKDELAIVVDQGASTQFLNVFELPPRESGPLVARVASPGTDSLNFQAGKPAIFPEDGSVTHFDYMYCRTPAQDSPVVMARGLGNFGNSNGWSVTDTTLSFDGSRFKVISTKKFTLPSSPDGTAPPPPGRPCFGPVT